MRISDWSSDVCSSDLLAQVRDRAEVIRRFRSAAFWRDVTVEALEAVRQDLRGIMQYRDKGGSAGPTPPRVIDVKDTEAVRAHRLTRIKSIDMAAYRQRVEQALSDLFDRDPTIKKIRAGEPVTERDDRK